MQSDQWEGEKLGQEMDEWVGVEITEAAATWRPAIWGLEELQWRSFGGGAAEEELGEGKKHLGDSKDFHNRSC